MVVVCLQNVPSTIGGIHAGNGWEGRRVGGEEGGREGGREGERDDNK